MSFLMILRIALKALNRNKMRTALTMLGHDHRRRRRHHDGGARHRRADLDRGADSVGRHQHDHRHAPATSRQGGVRQGQGNASTLIARRRRGDRAAAGRAVRRRRLEHARADHRRQPELEHAGAGHRRRLPAHPRRGRSTQGAFFTPQDVDDGGEGRRCSAASCAISCSAPDVDPIGQVIRIQNQPFTVVGVMASKGQSGIGPGSGRRGLHAVHDGDEEDARHHLHPASHRVGRLGRARSTQVADRIAVAAARAPQDPAGRPRRLHGAHDRGDGQRPQGGDADDDGAARRASPACRCWSAASAS